MSNVAYRLNRVDVWPTLTAIREYYLDHWPYLVGFRRDIEKLDGPSGANDALRRVEELRGAAYLSELQVFEENGSYIIRPLENGQFFEGNAHRWYTLELLTLNTPIASWISNQIKSRQYFIYLLIAKGDYAEVATRSIKRMVG